MPSSTDRSISPETHVLVTFAVAVAVPRALTVDEGVNPGAYAERAIQDALADWDTEVIQIDEHSDPTVIFGDPDGSLHLTAPWGDDD